MADNAQTNAVTPCDVCRYGKMSAECKGCPHDGPKTWGEIATGCGCLIVFIVVAAFVLAIFAL
jgi:hypothetical protein